MIPSDHFVRIYNEVFKSVEALGHEHLEDYFRMLGDLQTSELGGRFKQGRLQAAHDYWQNIFHEENCRGELALTADYFELRMDACPSLAKVLDNDAAPCLLYCDHCMGWVVPVMRYAGLYAVQDIMSRTEPRCLFRIYEDRDKAAAFARTIPGALTSF